MPGRYGRWLTSAAIFGVCYGAFYGLGIFDARQSRTFTPAVALFFCVIFAYIVPIYHYITERTRHELNKLKPVLSLDTTQLTHVTRRLSDKHRVWHIWVMGIGLALGLGHNVLLSGTPGAMLTRFSEGPAGSAAFIATVAVWLVMTSALAGLIDNVIIFAGLAKRATIDLLDTATLTPFARVAVFSTLAVVGAQASFSIMFINGMAEPWTYVPGLIATFGPVLLLISLPVWPVHRAIVTAKGALLRELNHAIKTAPRTDLASAESLQRLHPLLSLRREIEQVSEWPFDVNVATRLGLYLIIPPLTWVGAALIENLVEALIQVPA